VCRTEGPFRQAVRRIDSTLPPVLLDDASRVASLASQLLV
jgi:hypothetical protein